MLCRKVPGGAKRRTRLYRILRLITVRRARRNKKLPLRVAVAEKSSILLPPEATLDRLMSSGSGRSLQASLREPFCMQVFLRAAF